MLVVASADGRMDSYELPLVTVPAWEFDEYMSALENTLEEKLDEVPEGYRGMRDVDYGLGTSSGMQQDPWAVDRKIYRELLEGLDEVDSKTELFRYTQEVVETPVPVLPSPFNLIEKAMDGMIEAERGNIVQNVFEEAKQELADPQSK